VLDLLQMAVNAWRESIGEDTWQAFHDALSRRIPRTADAVEVCRRAGHWLDGVDAFTSWELGQRGWVGVFSIRPVPAEVAAAEGLPSEYGRDEV
jgi:hypothetical protein